MIADHRTEKSGTRREKRNAPDSPDSFRLRSYQTIGDIYDLEFSLVRKIWDGRETVKTQTATTSFPGPFPDI